MNPSPNINILLVDDREENLISLEAILDSPDYHLVSVTSGKEALRRILEDDFALILLDVQMPIMNGFETATLIKKRTKSKNIPIIFVTAINKEDPYVFKGYEAGAVDYIFKPFEPSVLRSKVAVFADLYRKTQLLLEAEQLKQEQRRAQLELEAAVREVQVRDDFLSIASHELKTPVTSLKLRLQMLESSLENGVSGETLVAAASSALKTSTRQVDRLTKLIDEMLDISRISGGRFTLVKEEFDLSKLVRETCERFALDFSQAKCALVLEIENEVRGHWDRQRIEQVFANLLTNALKYGHGKPVDVSLQREGQDAVIRVRDHGIGIAPSDHDKIFARYERAASSANFSGLGLGLYIVRQILDAHGGKIEVSSELGHGSTFTVRIPQGYSA